MNNNINLNLYKNFYEVAKHKSISLAAKENFISQPALSKSIKKLEEELGSKLFYRKLDGIELTEKGKELYFYIEEAFNSILTAERVMIETENLESGKLNIGVPSQIGTFYVFDNISKFHQMYPNIEITIVSNSTKHLLKQLESHEIDFIIDSSPVNVSSDKVVIRKLTDVNNCFFVRKDNIKNYNIISIKDLEKHPLILPIKGTANRTLLNKAFEDNKINPTNIMNIHTSDMIIGAVKRNLGIGYAIENLVDDDSDLAKLKIKEELPKIEINLVYVKKYLTAAPIKFIKLFINKDFKE